MNAPALTQGAPAPGDTHRALCLRCLRPESVCYCGKLQQVQTGTHVVFLQHPRERRVPVSTARMAHLSLPNSELHHGVEFEADSRVRAVAAEPDTYVLFPGDGAVEPAALRHRPPRNVIVVDGTWSLARKVIKVNPTLRALPRIGFVPRKPGNYRIRKEPAAHCVSTIEAVCELLGALEDDHDRFDRMLSAFDFMVDTQLQFVGNRSGPSRHRVHKSPPRPRVPAEYREQAHRLVVLYAEANAHPRGTGFDGVGELVHLVAERIHSGERFEALLRPRRPLAESTPFHLAVPAEVLNAGQPVDVALAAFRAFTRPDDLYCTWGGFALDLLRNEGLRLNDSRDVRLAAMRLFRGRPGAVEDAAEKLEVVPEPPFAQGRAGRRLAALSATLRGIVAVAGEISPRTPRP